MDRRTFFRLSGLTLAFSALAKLDLPVEVGPVALAKDASPQWEIRAGDRVWLRQDSESQYTVMLKRDGVEYATDIPVLFDTYRRPPEPDGYDYEEGSTSLRVAGWGSLQDGSLMIRKA